MTSNRLLNYLAFALLMISLALGFQSLWGLLFLYWSAWGIRAGQAVLLLPVTREEDPVLFWLIQLAWAVFGLWTMAADVWPALV